MKSAVWGLALLSAQVGWAAEVCVDVPIWAEAIRIERVQRHLQPVVDSDCLERHRRLSTDESPATGCTRWIDTGQIAVEISYESGSASTGDRISGFALANPSELGIASDSRSLRAADFRALAKNLDWTARRVNRTAMVRDWSRSDDEPPVFKEVPWQMLEICIRLKK